MRSITRFGRQLGGTAIMVAALAPSLAGAQAAARARPDSVARPDSAVTRAAAGKRSRLGALGRAAVAKANGAASRVEETTGISKETLAKAALAGTGVGAAAMLVGHDTASLTARAALGAGRSVLQHVEGGHADKVGGAGVTAAQQMELYRQQMAIAQAAQANAMRAGAAQSGPTPGLSPEMQRLQTEYAQLSMRAASGDAEAGQQLVRFAQEWSAQATRIATLPQAQQQAAYEVAMREALACAMTGTSCRK